MQFDMFQEVAGVAVIAPPPRPTEVEAAYTYDLDDEGFREFAERRGVLYQFARPGGRAWDYLCDYALGEAEWLADERVRYAQEYQGKRHRYEDDDMRSHWGVVMVQRDKVQRCWDAWLTTGAGR